MTFQSLGDVSGGEPRDRKFAGSGRRPCGVVLLEVAVEVVAVAVAAQDTEFQDGFGAVEALAGASDFHTVLGQSSGRTLDETAADGPSGGEESGLDLAIVTVRDGEPEPLVPGLRQCASANASTITSPAGRQTEASSVLTCVLGPGSGRPRHCFGWRRAHASLSRRGQRRRECTFV